MNVFDKVISAMIQKIMKNTTLALQLSASLETSFFIENTLVDLEVFESRFPLIEFCLSRTNQTKEHLILEFGVFRGKSINFMAEKTEKTIYGFDSFRGIPKNWIPGISKGAFNLQGIPPKVRDNVELMIGYFHETLPLFIERHKEPISLLHIDSDIYESAHLILESLEKQIVAGSIIIFDEYFNYPKWKQGEYRAFTEFITKHNKEFRYLGYNSLGEQVAVEILS